MADDGKSGDPWESELGQYMKERMENPEPDPVCGCGETKVMGLRLGFGWRWVCPGVFECEIEKAAIERFARLGVVF